VLVPFYGIVDGDVLAVLVLSDDSELVLSLQEKLLRAVALRLAPSVPMRLEFEGRVLDPSRTVGAERLPPLGLLRCRPAARLAEEAAS
jgi:hypothetical protein